MEAEQWSRIEELFHATLALDVAERSNYLLQQCSDDALLLHKVESLVAAHDKIPAFIQEPDLTLGFRVLSQSRAAERLDQTIAHYRIIKELGKGGMGEVYLAEDQDLQREVALKFFDSNLAGNEWARDQLIHEARAVAKLEHSNICAVYGFEEVGDHSFIVMQYVKGETLEELLKRKPLELIQALRMAEQIAGALSAAHERGIIHRDIKPRNLIVTPEGQIKILDFGLAKLVPKPTPEQPESALDHDTSTLGVAVGTAAYMSPEQANGEPLDSRTDIFSFGIVLYEMLTGKNPFLRQTRDETIDAIRECEPPLPTRQGKPLRGELRKILATCLEKNLDRRFRNTDELLIALRTERVRDEGPGPATLLTLRQRRRKQIRLFAVIAVPLLLLLLFGANYARVKLTGRHSLAVLKLMNKSGDKDLDYLIEGVTGNLVTKFSYFGRIETKAPTEFNSGAGEQPGVIQLGKKLNVEAVLYGELSKTNEAQLLHLRLINIERGAVEWEQIYDLANSDLFTLQNDVTRQVTSHLGLWLIGNERRLIEKRQTKSQEALEAYMTGRYHLNMRKTSKDLQLAIRSFDKALELDPAYARASAARADAFVYMANVAYGPIRTEDAINKARFDAQNAVDTDDTVAEAYNSLGKVKMWCEWKWPEAETEFQRAIQINPIYPQAHYDYSRLLALLGRHDQAIQESKIAVQYDPYALSSRANYGRSLYYARQLNEAEDYFRQLVNEYPNRYQPLHSLGLVLASEGKYPEAVLMLERAHEIEQLPTTAALGYAYGKAGRVAEALKMIDELDQFAKERPVSVYEKALVYLGMGRKDETIRLLQESVGSHYPNVINLGIDPMFDELRTDPQFVVLLKRIGLPESASLRR
jgi:serine/threonine protein kinase/Tfp pilus assembly protein PilF